MREVGRGVGEELEGRLSHDGESVRREGREGDRCDEGKEAGMHDEREREKEKDTRFNSFLLLFSF